MTNECTFESVTQIMREYFDDESLALSPETSAKDIEAWDSMNHVNIVVAVEHRFKVRFATAEVERLMNVGQLVELIDQKRRFK